MNNVEKFRDKTGKLLAYKVGLGLPAGLQAYSADEDFVQVLSWNYGEGKMLQSHIHIESPRIAARTQEAIIVLSGRLRANLYDEERQLLSSIVVGMHECMVFLAGGHGYEILQEDTKVFEVKNGPYPGLNSDKVKF